MMVLEFKQNSNDTENEIYNHLLRSDNSFIPSLSLKVNIKDYAKKIFLHASRFEYWFKNDLIALLAIYANDFEKKTAFITNMSVENDFKGQGIGLELLKKSEIYLKSIDFNEIELEVNTANLLAQKFYYKNDFLLVHKLDNSLILNKKII